MTDIPLSDWAGRTLKTLAKVATSPQLSALKGATLLGERGGPKGFAIPGARSAGGGCTLYSTRCGAIALNLSRAEDRDLLPALFMTSAEHDLNDAWVMEEMAAGDARLILSRGRELGLAIAHTHEDRERANPAVERCNAIAPGTPPRGKPLVVDLSALWAGPLAGHLLALCGARVIKVESHRRLDTMRDGDPAQFAVLNQGKQSVVLDFGDRRDLQGLVGLIGAADIVIESSRPRALEQLGIQADLMLRHKPGLVWISVTGHGGTGTATNWVGFGDDCGVAGGLSRAMEVATGKLGFVGDAIADPLTGILAALTAWQAWRSGDSGRYFLSMSGTVAAALAEEQDRNPMGLHDQLNSWAGSAGEPFPCSPRRNAGPIATLGQHTHAVLAEFAP